MQCLSLSCDDPFILLSCFLLASSAFALTCGQHGTVGKSKQRSWVPTTSDSSHRSKRARVSQRSFAEGAGDSGLMEVALAANAKQKPLECLTTVLLRERLARSAGQAQEDAQSNESVRLCATCLHALPRSLRWDAPPVVQDRRTGSRDGRQSQRARVHASLKAQQGWQEALLG